MADTQPTNEQWRDIPGWEGLYQVSDLGRVRSLDRPVIHKNGMIQNRQGKLLRFAVMQRGHLRVSLSRDGKTVRKYVHQLVVESFIGAFPEGTETLHADGDPANNHVSNLRAGSRSENVLDMVSHGDHVQARKTHCAQGHPYSPENTRLVKGKWRECKTCRRATKARYLSRQKSR